jgi:putative nucleotidyltransferase with HDIG domain
MASTEHLGGAAAASGAGAMAALDAPGRQLDEVVRAAFESQRFRPPLLPEVAMSLSRLVEDPDADLSMAEATVVKDPTVAARVVAVANSAVNGGRAPVTSLRTAIGRLGLYQVRDVAFQVVALGKVFRVPAYAERMRDLFEASQAAGMLARAVAEARQEPNDAAYLCGLLHDMGEASVLAIVAEARSAPRLDLPSLEALGPVVDRWHTRVGALVCTKWELPEVVVDAVAHHHEPERSEHSGSLAPLIAVADLLLRHVGIGRPWQPVTKADMPLLEAARLAPERIGPLLRRAEELAADRGAWACTGG